MQGGTWPARIWQRFMSLALADAPIQPLRYPDDLAQTVLIDPETGGIATPFCPVTEELTALPQELPDFFCPLHTSPQPSPEPSDDPSEDPSEPWYYEMFYSDHPTFTHRWQQARRTKEPPTYKSLYKIYKKAIFCRKCYIYIDFYYLSIF